MNIAALLLIVGMVDRGELTLAAAAELIRGATRAADQASFHPALGQQAAQILAAVRPHPAA